MLPHDAGVANAVGAAISQIGGAVDCTQGLAEGDTREARMARAKVCMVDQLAR